MDASLIRHAYLPDCTLGQLRMDGLALATLEEPWIPNHAGPGGARRRDGRESCVPDGEYELVPHSGTRFKDVWCLVNRELGVFRWPEDVPQQAGWGRSTVLIHQGNTVDDILGCILVGLVHGRLDGKPAVLRSGDALNLLRGKLDGIAHRLTIRPTGGTT